MHKKKKNWSFNRDIEQKQTIVKLYSTDRINSLEGERLWDWKDTKFGKSQEIKKTQKQSKLYRIQKSSIFWEACSVFWANLTVWSIPAVEVDLWKRLEFFSEKQIFSRNYGKRIESLPQLANPEIMGKQGLKVWRERFRHPLCLRDLIASFPRNYRRSVVCISLSCRFVLLAAEDCNMCTTFVDICLLGAQCGTWESVKIKIRIKRSTPTPFKYQ